MAKQNMAVWLIAGALSCGGRGDVTEITSTEQPGSQMEPGSNDEQEDVQRDVLPSRPGREGPAGCYIPAEFRCDCELSEAECSDETTMVWASGCMSCAD